MGEFRKLSDAAGRFSAGVKHWLINILYTFLGINGILMVAVALLQISSRMLGRPVAWTVELLLFLGLYSIIPGAALIFLKGQEIEVAFIVERLPRPWRVAAECFTSLAGFVYGIFLFWGNVNYGYLVNLGKPEQFLPFPPVVNTLPIYLLAAAIVWDMCRKLKETLFCAPPRGGKPKERGPQ